MGDPSSTINPLVSRLDRLDFLLKYLERRTKSEGLESNNRSIVRALCGRIRERPTKGYLPMNLALKEAESKGSLVDRVAALESRLFQVSLEMDECSGTSQSSSSGNCSQTSWDTTLSLKSRGDSLPTFNHPHKIMTTTHEIEEKSEEEIENVIASPPKQKSKKNKKEKKDKKSCKTGKKRTFPSWTHILGC